MGAGEAGRHPYPFPFDAGEVVGREPGSVATGSGNRRRRPCGDWTTGPVRWQGPGVGESPFSSSFWFLMYSNPFLLFNTVFYLFLYQLNGFC